MTSKDTITKIKEQEEKTKTTQITNKDEEYLGGSDEEDNQKTKGAVQEQAATSSNKPKTLKDLFNADASDKQVKPKTKHVQKTEKVQNQATDGKRFYNSKKVNDNKDLPQTSATQKKTYTGKGGQNSQKYNESIKPQKNYLEKDIQKEYTEDVNIAKPEFKSKAEGQNFVELNKNEDLFAKNMAQHNFDFKKEYNDDKEKTEQQHEKKKKHHHQHKKQTEYTKEDIENDVDSDGFEITGTKEKKKENLPRKPKQHKHYNEGKKRYYKKKDDKPSETAPQEEGEKTETPVVKLPETQTAEVKVGQAKSLKELLG